MYKSGNHLIHAYLTEKVPSNYLSSAFEIATISAKDATNFFPYDNNPNFGQAPWTPQENATLTVTFLNFVDPIKQTWLAEIVSLWVNVKISRAINSTLSRLKIVVTYP